MGGLTRRRTMSGNRFDKNTRLLLHAEDFKDSSMYNLTMTNQNSRITVQSDNYKFGSNAFKGGTSSQRLYTTIGDFIRPTNDFTIEMWVYTSISYQGYAYLFGTNATTGANNGINVIAAWEYLEVTKDSYGDGLIFDTNDGLNNNSWNHVALVNLSGRLTIYINGQSSGSSTRSWSSSTTNFGIFSSGVANSSAVTVYMDEIRVSDVARYTSNFTPPSVPFNS